MFTVTDKKQQQNTFTSAPKHADSMQLADRSLDSLYFLQRNLGNSYLRAVSGTDSHKQDDQLKLQTKLVVGLPDDEHEQEADLVADQVVANRTAPLSVSSLTSGRLQHQDAPKEKTDEEKYKEGLEKLGEAFLKTPLGKELLEKIKQNAQVKGAIETWPGKIVTGAAATGVVAALAATHKELPVQIPEIPLDVLIPGLSVKLTYTGPVDKPTEAMITFKFAEQTPQGGADKKPVSETDRFRAETAKLAAELANFRAGITYRPGSPEDLQQKADDLLYRRWQDAAMMGLVIRQPNSFLTPRPKSGLPDHAGLQLTMPQFSFGIQPPSLLDDEFKLNLPGEQNKKPDEPELQKKLSIGASNDPLEQEADRVAEQVLATPANPVVRGKIQSIQRYTGQPSEQSEEIPASVDRVLGSSGIPLDTPLREDMESRFGHDFSQVRVHLSGDAEQSAREVNAYAYTVGHNIVFGADRYAPSTDSGRRLIAHELTHVVQQSSSSSPLTPDNLLRYTDAERREMAEGRVKGQAPDLAMAAKRHFELGDIVFRLGSNFLAFLTSLPVTHGGIYVGNGLIHDVVAFGNRHIRVTDFFNPALGEAANPNTCRVARFQGPLHQLIVSRLIGNISRRDFRMPTDPVPFNLFSSADDYRTATCLEYAHAQFLYAIFQLSSDQSVQASDRQLLRQTYFTGSSAEPNALIQPQEQRFVGNMVDPGNMGNNNLFGSVPPRTISAISQEAALIGAATAMASDTDTNRFQNRSESRYIQHWLGGDGIGWAILNSLIGPTYDEVVLRTFTYQSFVDSRQFFQVMTPA